MDAAIIGDGSGGAAAAGRRAGAADRQEGTGGCPKILWDRCPKWCWLCGLTVVIPVRCVRLVDRRKAEFERRKI